MNSAFLAATEVIDWKMPEILMLAGKLGEEAETDEEIARRCFEWVRDQISHTLDAGRSEVTCSASEVLRLRTGFCYAKSHLLAALLRANGIPAGFIYQRLWYDDSGRRFCLHGLNEVLLKRFGWRRVDPRGNKPGISTAFAPPEEHLAFPGNRPGECDIPGRFAEPLPIVVSLLTRCSSASQVLENLPDIAPITLA